MTAGLLEQEAERLRELMGYEILDTPEEEEFNDVVKLASQICNASIALITFIDDCRQWFKAKVGVEVRETTKDIAFCTHTLQYENGMEVEDTLKDERFSKNPLVVDEPYIRFYAGVPLISPQGIRIGTLCVLDQEPKKLTEDQRFALETLAKYVMQLLELKKKNQGLQKVMKEHKELQELTEKQQNALARAQNAAKIGIYQWNLKTDLIKVSPAFCALFGIEECPVLSREEFLQYIHPDDLKGFLRYFKRVIKSGRHFDYEYRCLKGKRKKEIYNRSTGELVRAENGTPERIIGVMQDITHKWNYEKKLRKQNAELKKVNQELDNFVYRVSHDLRAPISSMLGLIDIIVNHEHQLDKIRELLMLIKKSLAKQDKFIKDILDFSRNSRLVIEPQEIDFQTLLEDIIAQFVFEGQADQISYTLEVDQQEPYATDKNRLDIIMANLISNAFKYVKSKGEAAKVEISIFTRTEHAEIIIKDNGIGIEQEHLDKVFNMFYRATDNQPGSGLGLYMVREAVLKVGGRVSLESKTGQGTKVVVHLPNLLYTTAPD